MIFLFRLRVRSEGSTTVIFGNTRSADLFYLETLDNRTGVGPIWALDKLSEKSVKELTTAYRQRQQCLKSVDDLVDVVVQKLDETGTLERTYIFYSSDNGYHLGNHRLLGGT